MEFLVHISLSTPEGMPAADVDDLRRREAERARELAAEGRIVRLWRAPGEWANWGLWDAADETALIVAIDSLPLRPFLRFDIVPLQRHPSDPAPSKDTEEDDAFVVLGDLPLSVAVTRRAAVRGVDLETITGSGPAGLIRLADVERARPSLVPRSPDATYAPRIPALAPLPALASPSHRDVPSGATASGAPDSPTVGPSISAIEVDMTAVDDARSGARSPRTDLDGEALPRLRFLAAACLHALSVRPAFSALIDSAALRRAVSDPGAWTSGGSPGEPELTGGSFAVVDTGGRGLLFDTPRTNPSRRAVLAAGANVRRPVVVRTPEGEESISIRSIAWLTLACDAQAVAATDAADFLVGVKTALEDPDLARQVMISTESGA